MLSRAPGVRGLVFEERVDRYWHLTNWTDVEVGRVYCTSWGLSHYWNAIEDEAQASIMADGVRGSVRSIYEALGGSESDADIEADRLGRAKAESQRRKEREFEGIRRAEFASLPPRSSSIFLCESEDQLRAYLQQFEFPVEGRSILELEVVTPELSPEQEEDWATGLNLSLEDLRDLRTNRQHRANPRFLNCNSHPSSFSENARRYWRGDETSTADLTEVLLRGFFRPVKILHP